MWQTALHVHYVVAPVYVLLSNPHTTTLYIILSNISRHIFERLRNANVPLHNKSTILSSAQTQVIKRCVYKGGKQDR